MEDRLRSTQLFPKDNRADLRLRANRRPGNRADRFDSISHIALLSAPERLDLSNQFRAILSSDPQTAGRERIVLSYRTDAFICQAC